MDRLTFYDNMEKFWRVVDDAEVRDGLPTKGEYVEQSVIDRLAAYEDAEEQGRLIILPCKVGDTLYHIGRGSVEESRVAQINLELCMDSGEGINGIRGIWWTHDYNIGKTVFLTREAAEAALGGDVDG